MNYESGQGFTHAGNTMVFSFTEARTISPRTADVKTTHIFLEQNGISGIVKQDKAVPLQDGVIWELDNAVLSPPLKPDSNVTNYGPFFLEGGTSRPFPPSLIELSRVQISSSERLDGGENT